MVEEPQGQGGLDGEIRVPPLPGPDVPPLGTTGADEGSAAGHRAAARLAPPGYSPASQALPRSGKTRQLIQLGITNGNPQPRTLLHPGGPYWEKCARHRNSVTTRFVAHLFLCNGCTKRLERECFNDRPPIFEGLPLEGYCGLCNQRTAVQLRQWFVCPICTNVVLSYPKGFAASRYVHEFWAREVRPVFPDLLLDELDEVRLESYGPGDRSKKTKGKMRQEVDFRVSKRTGDHSEPLFQIELKAGPTPIDQMREFQLDVNDFNDIVASCNATNLPVYVFHVQINDDYYPPTRRSLASNLWWTDARTLDRARKAIRQRRGDDDKRAGYYDPAVFRPREAFLNELRASGHVTLTEQLQANPLTPI